MGQAKTAEGEREQLEGQIYDLSFSVHRIRRYHEKMTAFYRGWHNSAKVVTVISGSGAFFLILASAPIPAAIISAFVALWAALDIVMAPGENAGRHADLGKQFTALARKIEVMPKTEAAYQEMAAARLQLEEAEPPCKRLVDLQARNDECRARGFPPDDLVPLSKTQRWLGYFVTFGMARLEEWKANRQRAAANAAAASAKASAPTGGS